MTKRTTVASIYEPLPIRTKIVATIGPASRTPAVLRLPVESGVNQKAKVETCPMDSTILWQRHQRYRCCVPSLGLSLDKSRMRFEDGFFERIGPSLQNAFQAMDSLEQGAIANPDEKRMVGHYWLRAPNLSPTPEISGQIRAAVADVKSFAAAVHGGKFKSPSGVTFSRVLSIGIGGSALGPMFVADALGDPASDKMRIDFIDNTDPDGIVPTLERLDGRLKETLCVVTSKSGGTPETRNGMLLVAEAYRQAGLEFPRHVVAITMAGSAMDKTAKRSSCYSNTWGPTAGCSQPAMSIQGRRGSSILTPRRKQDESARKKQRGGEIPADVDPRVVSVTRIHNYFKKFSEGIRNFYADTCKLEQYVRETQLPRMMARQFEHGT